MRREDAVRSRSRRHKGLKWPKGGYTPCLGPQSHPTAAQLHTGGTYRPHFGHDFKGGAQKALLKENLTKFAFLSAPLQGLTDHLLTLANGNHVKPLIRVPGQKPVPLADAQKAAQEIEIDIDDLGLIDGASDPTLYGPYITLLGKQQSGFKPTTHGQFRFTKLNTMDKFGQAISVIDPVPADSGHALLYPCISEFFAPQPLLADGLPNIVDRSRSSKKGSASSCSCRWASTSQHVSTPLSCLLRTVIATTAKPTGVRPLTGRRRAPSGAGS
ncbi:hypothetical protein ACMFMG_004761 [Clarireedia jacksonii]